MERSIAETPSSPLQTKTLEIQNLCENEQLGIINDSNIVISRERLKRQLNLLDDLDNSPSKEIEETQTVPEGDSLQEPAKISSRLIRLLGELDSISEDSSTQCAS